MGRNWKKMFAVVMGGAVGKVLYEAKEVYEKENHSELEEVE